MPPVSSRPRRMASILAAGEQAVSPAPWLPVAWRHVTCSLFFYGENAN